jgi:hypothetical protein
MDGIPTEKVAEVESVLRKTLAEHHLDLSNRIESGDKLSISDRDNLCAGAKEAVRNIQGG